MIGIYKITNLVNGQIYIGQSIDIANRWVREYNSAFNPKHPAYNYPLQKDFRKFKKENFSFEVIEECKQQELNQKEKYWIDIYNSFNQGYNQTIGGSYGICKISERILQEIYNDLANTEISFKELSIKYSLDEGTLRRINTGRVYYNLDLKYPIRKDNSIIGERCPDGYCQRCGKQISNSAYYCIDCYNLLNRKVERPSKEELEKYLFSINGNFSEAGKKFGVTDNSVRKWCKSYGLSTYSSDYKVKVENPNKGRTIPKKILQFDLNNNFIAEYESIADACRAIGKPGESSHISAVCKGKRNSVSGYKWKYKE